MGPLTSDQRPSDLGLLRLIERILGRNINGDAIAKEDFFRRLPAQSQLIVRSQTDIFTVGQLAQMADRLASVPVISQDFEILRVQVSRDDDAVTLASINVQLSKVASSNERISGEVNALKRCRHLLNPPTDLLALFIAISHAVRECSWVSTLTVSVGMTKCGVRLQGNALMAAVMRETTARETTARSVEAITHRPTSSCRLLTIQDPVSKLSYLIDTDAEVSVLPSRSEDRNRSQINNNYYAAAVGEWHCNSNIWTTLRGS